MKYFFLIGWWLAILFFPAILNASEDKPRPFYEYRGDYRGKINAKKGKFLKAYGYNLLDLDASWRPDEIDLIHKAFAQLPDSFYRIPELKAFYRVTHISSTREGFSAELVPAATFPSFSPIFRHQSQSHNIYIEKDHFRVEFYNPLFHEDESKAINIIHHELAHALDMSRGFISVSKKWLKISHFKVLNLPALDQRKDADFLFTFINQFDVETYAPVSLRHRITYSRTSPQEDFANSISAYIHYPYFLLSNPKRYKFLKKNIFNEKEYFSLIRKPNDFNRFLLEDINKAYEKKDWFKIKQIILEISRGHFPKLVKDVSSFLLDNIMGLPSEALDTMVEASCFLMHPKAVEFRRQLVRKKRINVKQVLGKQRCFMVGRDNFEKLLSKQPIRNMYFFRDGSNYYIQFMDSEEPIAFSRGFISKYQWEISYFKGPGDLISKGQRSFSSSQNGSFRLNLGKSADGKLMIPVGKKLVLRVKVRRNHPRNFKNFESNPKQIRFVVYPWFEYLMSSIPKIKTIYPMNLLSLNSD